jgi:Raf kinase inhibitor-like YbhB/YbcL family protein
MKRLLLVLGIIGLASHPVLAANPGRVLNYTQDKPRTASVSSDRLKVVSVAFKNGGAIPRAYAADGRNLTPPISWSPGPKATRSYALILEDVSSEQSSVHWLAYNIPASTPAFGPGSRAASGKFKADKTRVGRNSTGAIGYVGPKPPLGDKAHRYSFRVFALDTFLGLPRGADRDTVMAAMRGHVVAQGELVATYKSASRPPPHAMGDDIPQLRPSSAGPIRTRLTN